MMDFISGVVERITYTNEENGFTVIKIKSKGYSELITVVGNFASVNVGASLQIKGQWKYDSKYGKQFQALDFKETVPATIVGIEKYLGSGLIKGIGPVYAKRIVKHFKEDTLRIIEEEPDRLIEVEGIGEKRLQMIKKDWQEQKEIKNIMIFLQSYGVSTSYGVKIYKTYGDESIQIVKENPYRLADDIWGIGFKTADKIAEKLGYRKDSPERCRSGIIYLLNDLSNEGHCYVMKEELTEKAVHILEVSHELVERTIAVMLEEKSLIIEESGAIYLPPFYHSETGVVKRIKEILACDIPKSEITIEKALESIQKEHHIQYDEIQLKAVKCAANSKFMVLTGGPGTGKTTTTLAIIEIFKRMNKKILLAAPTGRAARRMSEATGMEAKTIHRLLEYKPSEGYQKNESNPLDCDVLIIDEVSMVDIILMYNLLKAVKNSTIVILVGDVDQLPSVGAGNLLKDIIDSAAIPVIKLTKIFRQAQGSAIIINAHRINKGMMPILKGGKNTDFFFIPEEEPSKVAEIIKELCSKRLPRYYQVDPIEDIQVLCPMQRGECGAYNMNILLQEALNPSKTTIRYGGTNYRLNDKVMQIKNNYDKNVFNGDIGRIVKINQEDKILTIRFDDNDIDYDITELDEVVLAYATAVHKSQGSEYKIVVAPFTMQHYMMLQRNLLYTCVTRAKKVLVLVGSKKAISIAVANNKIQKRNTLLESRLKESLCINF